MIHPDETMMRAVFAPARELEPTDAEVTAVLLRSARRPRRRRAIVRTRFAIAGLIAFAVLGGGAYAVPVTRAAIQDVADTFAGWAGGDSSAAPGRPLGADEDAASFLRESGDPRVLAEADGYKLIAAKQRDGSIDFDLGDTGVGIGNLPASDFRGHALFVLGPGSVQHADEHGHVPLFGVTARSVKTVELVYPSGPPLRVSGIAGGFVLLAEPTRNAEEVVAYDGSGNELERAPLQSDHGVKIHWDSYGAPAPRVPTRCLPGVAGLNPPPDCPSPNG
jgi:hypothetical protein